MPGFNSPSLTQTTMIDKQPFYKQDYENMYKAMDACEQQSHYDKHLADIHEKCSKNNIDYPLKLSIFIAMCRVKYYYS